MNDSRTAYFEYEVVNVETNREGEEEVEMELLGWKPAPINVKDQVLLSMIRSHKLKGDGMVSYRIHEGREEDENIKDRYISIFFTGDIEGNIDGHESRAIACFLGLTLGDALGSTNEYFPVTYEGERKVSRMMGGGRYQLRPGQWTDDTSMALCLADSFIARGADALDRADALLRLAAWWEGGMNNGFCDDDIRESKHSIGLGKANMEAIRKFIETGNLLGIGNRNTNGIGTICRLAPITLVCCKDETKAMDFAKQSSFLTHRGIEAAECCRLLAFLCVRAINYDSTARERKRYVLNDAIKEFETHIVSIKALRDSKQEIDKNASSNNLKLSKKYNPDRDWRWKAKKYRYSHKRATQPNSNVGSYCMDAMAMALHCVYATETFRDALLKCVNIGGDADSVGAICGQLAGAIYGLNEISVEWVQEMQNWDFGGDILLKAAMLYKIGTKTADDD